MSDAKDTSSVNPQEFRSKLRSLVLPITMQQFMIALVSATDALMLGLVDQTSLSAVSLAGQVQFVLQLLTASFVSGTGILAAQYWGKRDLKTVQALLPIVLRINASLGVLFTLAGLFCPELLMKIFTDSPELILAGADYLRAVAPSYLFFSISQIYLCVLKNTGHTAASSRISSMAVLINIVLNTLLIFGLFGFPAMGISGAAYATDIARLIELVWGVWKAVSTRRLPLRLDWKAMTRWFTPLERDFWRYTTPLIGATLVWGIGYTLYSVILGHMGSDAVAANSIASIVKNLLFCLCQGLAHSAGILVGNLLGAGQLEKARLYGGRLTRLSILIGAITGGVLVLISPLIVAFAPLSEASAHHLQWMLIFSAVYTLAKSINCTVLNGIFCAGGDAKFDMQGNIGAMWCFSIPLGFLAAFYFKLPVLAVYCIVNLDEIVKIPAVYLHYKKYIWLKDLTKSNALEQ